MSVWFGQKLTAASGYPEPIRRFDHKWASFPFAESICAAVHGLDLCDLFLRVAYDVFQDHFKMHEDCLHLQPPCLLIIITTPIGN